MCGVINGNANDDFLQGNGETLDAASLPRWRNNILATNFVSGWRYVSI